MPCTKPLLQRPHELDEPLACKRLVTHSVPLLAAVRRDGRS